MTAKTHAELFDLFDAGSWDRPGRCGCGQPLPPQLDWEDAGSQWQHVTCKACGVTYVDEEEEFRAYEGDDPDADGSVL